MYRVCLAVYAVRVYLLPYEKSKYKHTNIKLRSDKQRKKSTTTKTAVLANYKNICTYLYHSVEVYSRLL